MVEFEQRLLALEEEVEDLRAQLGLPVRKDWLSRMVGAFSKYPEFGEVIRYGREWRESQPIEEDEGEEDWTE